MSMGKIYAKEAKIYKFMVGVCTSNIHKFDDFFKSRQL
jgi:hypothetical protein